MMEARARAELLAEIRSKSKSSSQPGEPTGGDGLEVPPPPGPPLLQRSMWSASDGKWPVSPEIIERVTGNRGLARFGERAKLCRRKTMVSKDKNLLPPGTKFVHRCPSGS